MLNVLDDVSIRSKWDLQERQPVSVHGLVRSPGTYELLEGMTLTDLLMKAGGLTDDALASSAEVARVSVTSGGQEITQTLRVPLNRDLTRAGEAAAMRLEPHDGPLIIGRGQDAGFQVNDQRVSRRHARIEWNGGQCVLTDSSSNGTWVRFAGSPVAVTLRRDSCTLNGEGEIGLGATADDFTAPTVGFRVLNDA